MRRGFALLATMVLVQGCGAGNAEEAAPEVPSASGGAAPARGPSEDVKRLAIIVEPGPSHMDRSVLGQVQAALLAAGMRVMDAPDGGPVAKVIVDTHARPSQSFFQVSVNGQQSMDVVLSLAVIGDEGTIETFATQFTSSSSEVPDADLRKVAARVAGSSRLQQYAVKAKDKQAHAEQAKQQAAAAEKKKVDASKAEWEEIVGECREPKSVHSCDSLRNWYIHLGGMGVPRSSLTRQDEQRRDEAKAILEGARPAIRKFAEADAWEKADPSRCAAAAAEEDCQKLRDYARAFRDFAGAEHMDEANKVLAEADKKFAAKAEREQQRADAEAREAARRTQLASCKAKCSSDTCVAFTVADKKAQCVAKCEQECK